LVVIVLTAGLFVVLVPVVPSLWVWPAYAVFGGASVLLTVTDMDTKLIPNRILGPAVAAGSILLGAGWLAAMDSGSVVRALGGGVAYFGVMYLLALLARGGLGFGDVKLAFLIGIFAGYLSWGAVVVAGLGAFIIGGTVSVGLLVGRTRGRKDEIPFGPFMTVAGIIAVVWGSQIVAWYSG
jgi:leader peptidase (prepilin peptidase)/N-methyltransferase